jgi:RNA polymerase sporulation-specific sigma factor
VSALEETLALIGRAHQGDKEARNRLFEQNTGLIHSVVRRFLGRGVDAEDLFQIGSIGLLKALERFDPAFDVKLSSYAVPMIAGEIRRYLRDNNSILKVSRGIKENQYKIWQEQQKLWESLGREPTFSELSESLHMEPEELVMAMEAQSEVESLHRPICQGDGTEIELLDKVPDEKNPQERLLNEIFLEEILDTLEEKERDLIQMRYYENMTQTQVAEKIGISQVQVSRMEKKILKRLRLQEV